MKFLVNARISTKFVVVLLLFGAISLALGFYSKVNMEGAVTDYSVLTTKKLPTAVRLARQTRLAMQMVYIGYESVARDPSTAEAQGAIQEEGDIYAKAMETLALAKKDQPQMTDDLVSLEQALGRVHAQARQAIALSLQSRDDEANRVLGVADKELTSYVANIVEINEGLIKESADTSSALSASVNATAMLSLILTALASLGAIGLGILVTRVGITGPLARLQEMMGRLAGGETKLDVPGSDRGDEIGTMAKAVLVFRDNAVAMEKAAVVKAKADAEQKQVVDEVGAGLGKLSAGDLTAELQGFPADYAKLQGDFNAAVGELRTAMAAIARATANIHGGSGEISQASDDLSRRTEQQAASLEETAAAMTEITATVQNSAIGANEANKLVAATQADAQESSKVVSAAVEAMAGIEKSSQQISQIITVIEKIAFQTNLLALNASVEAAHAGEAGRAFAVVANEVRALAQRSADAAQEIGQLILTSTAQVDSGVKLVGDAGHALERIIGSVDEISGLVSQIAMAADQQSSALAQVNTAVTEMDKVTQQNAAMVEESTAAARSLSDEATGLSSLVGRFQTGQEAAPVRAVARPKPAPRPVAHGNTALMLQSNLAEAVDDWNEF